jgi:hypothetical protein
MVGEPDAQGHQPQLKRNDSTFAVKKTLNSWKNFNSDFCDGVKKSKRLLWGTILRPTIPRETFLLVFFVSSHGRHVYVIKIPLLCPTLRAKFCGLRIFGCACLVTDWAAFVYLIFSVWVLLSILSDGVGGVCKLYPRGCSVLLGQKKKIII